MSNYPIIAGAEEAKPGPGPDQTTGSGPLRTPRAPAGHTAAESPAGRYSQSLVLAQESQTNSIESSNIPTCTQRPARDATYQTKTTEREKKGARLKTWTTGCRSCSCRTICNAVEHQCRTPNQRRSVGKQRLTSETLRSNSLRSAWTHHLSCFCQLIWKITQNKRVGLSLSYW